MRTPCSVVHCMYRGASSSTARPSFGAAVRCCRSLLGATDCPFACAVSAIACQLQRREQDGVAAVKTTTGTGARSSPTPVVSFTMRAIASPTPPTPTRSATAICVVSCGRAAKRGGGAEVGAGESEHHTQRGWQRDAAPTGACSPAPRGQPPTHK